MSTRRAARYWIIRLLNVCNLDPYCIRCFGLNKVDSDPARCEWDCKSGFLSKQIKQRKPYGSKKKKDPQAPAAHISAYALFFKETQANVKSQNPGNF